MSEELDQFRLDRLEKSDEKKLTLLEKMYERIETIERERLLEKQRTKYVLTTLVIVGSFAMDFVKKFFGLL